MSTPTTDQVTALLQSAGLMPGDAADVGAQLAASIAEVNLRLRRRYVKVTETRYFDGNNSEWLFPTAFLSISAIKRVDTLRVVLETLDVESYLTYPEVETPKTALRRVDPGDLTWGDPELLNFIDYPPETFRHTRWRKAFWSFGAQNYAITGVWADADGYPDDVSLAIAQHAALGLAGPIIGAATGGVKEWGQQGIATETMFDRPYSEAIKSWRENVDGILSLRRRKFLIIR